MPFSASSRSRVSARRDAAVERHLPVGECRRQHRQRGLPAARHRHGVAGQGGDGVRGREDAGHPVAVEGLGQVVACQRDEHAAEPVRRLERDLLPQHGPQGDLVAVDVSGHPEPGTAPERVREHGVVTQRGVHGVGVAAGVEQAPAALGRRPDVAEVGQREPAEDGPGPAGLGQVEPHHAVPVGQPQAAGVPPGPAASIARHEVEGEELRHPLGVEGQPHRDADVDADRGPTVGRATTLARDARSAAPAQLGRRGGVHLLERVVELPDAGEPGGEGHVDRAPVGRLQQDPGVVGATGPRQRQRPGAELGDEQPVEVARAVAEARGQPLDALPVDDPVGDEAHGATGVSAATSQRGESGVASGRQRRHARKPAAWAEAAVGWKVTFRGAGCAPGTRAGSRCRSSAPRCRRPRRSAGRGSTRRGSTPRRRGARARWAGSCTHPASPTGGIC